MIRIPLLAAWALLALGLAWPAHADELAQVQQLVRAGQPAQAMARLDEFLAAKPKDAQLRFMKGVLLTDAKRPDEAIAVFTQLNEDYPELPEPYNNLAVLYAGQGQYDKARAALEAAVRGNPNYAIAYENLGDVYTRLAAQAYARALALDANNPALAPKITQLRGVATPVPSASPSSTTSRNPSP